MHDKGEVKIVSLEYFLFAPLASGPVRHLRFRLLAAVLGGTLGVAACDDPFDFGARFENATVAIEAWGLSGTPAEYPAALLVAQQTAVRPDAGGNFDLAFEVTDEGRVVVMPMNRVVSPVTGPRNIGLLRGEGTYSDILEAPRTGWDYDTVLTLNPGQTFLVRVQTLYCQFDVRQDVYAKFFIDSVIPAERRFRMSGVVNPNCGFRSFAPGIPRF